jgi:hypothetical protein
MRLFRLREMNVREAEDFLTGNLPDRARPCALTSCARP